MIRAEGFHQLILNPVDILKLVNHNIFKALLPFLADLVISLENVQNKFQQVVIVQPEALFFLIQVTVKNYVVSLCRSKVFLVNLIQTHADKIFVVVGLFEKFFDFNHVARVRKSHLPQSKTTLLVNYLKHCINIRIIQNEKTFRVRDSMRIFLKNAYTKTVESGNVTCVIVAGELTDSVSHFGCGFIRKSNAENVRWKNTDFVYKVGKTVGECAGFT